MIIYLPTLLWPKHRTYHGFLAPRAIYSSQPAQPPFLISWYFRMFLRSKWVFVKGHNEVSCLIHNGTLESFVWPSSCYCFILNWLFSFVLSFQNCFQTFSEFNIFKARKLPLSSRLLIRWGFQGYLYESVMPPLDGGSLKLCLLSLLSH